MKKTTILFFALVTFTLSLQAESYALYGMTNQLSSIFKLDPVTHGAKHVFYFDSINGLAPNGSLMQAQNGLLYGMTNKGGLYGMGVLFSYNSVTNKEAVHVEFKGTNGEFPYASLIQGTDGLLYGMTSQGGTRNEGVIFSYNTITGQDSVLFNFDSLVSGGEPFGSLIQASNGMMYGLTHIGGPLKDMGVLFGFDPIHVASTFQVLVDSINTPYYVTLIQATNGLLYGTDVMGGNMGGGQVFSYNINNGVFTSVVNFDIGNPQAPHGSSPLAGVTQATNGLIYGMTTYGSAKPSGNGNIFSYDPVTGGDTVLYTFMPPIRPGNGGFMQDTNTGLLYAPAYSVYMVQLDPKTNSIRTDTLLYPCNDGNLIMASLIDSLHDSISGAVYYYNSNYNCGNDSFDIPAPSIIVNAVHNGIIYETAVTGSNGHYVFNNLPKGYSFTIQLQDAVQQGYIIQCPSAGYINTASSSSGNNFVIQCNAGFDLSGSLQVCLTGITGQQRANITVCIHNNLCTPANATLKLLLDTAMHQWLYPPPTPFISGDTLIWKLGYVSQKSLTEDICMQVVVSVDSLSPKDSLSLTFIADPVNGDAVPQNNIFTIKFPTHNENCYSSNGNNTATGIQQLATPQAPVKCFPNPFNFSTQLLFNTEGKHYIELGEITGRKITSLECVGKQYQLMRNSLAPGIYFIQVFDDTHTYLSTLKIAVQ